MDKSNLYGLVLSGIAGTITSVLHTMQRGVKHSWRKVLLQFGIGFCAIYPAYLAGEVLKLDKNMLLVAGYLAGILGDRVIQEIYRREAEIYSFFIGDRKLKGGDEESL
jgi:hypothetical protein